MVRDVLIASMNKGLFPLALPGIIFMLIIIKMPAEDVSKFAFNFIERLANNGFIGYIIAVVAIFGWYYHARWQRKSISREIKRIGQQKTRWQEQKLSKKLESSDKP